ncbi:hypothetical protein J2S01_001023 [Pectinatus haikarae]|uniref:Photosystem II protein I n=1 Tax=Pectinatus haikarae TaxID=349096 RepID=A0ABT9Y7X6_9FIRM|nr:hypothetical protein [Pectinatus haikarae]
MSYCTAIFMDIKSCCDVSFFIIRPVVLFFNNQALNINKDFYL